MKEEELRDLLGNEGYEELMISERNERLDKDAIEILDDIDNWLEEETFKENYLENKFR